MDTETASGPATEAPVFTLESAFNEAKGASEEPATPATAKPDAPSAETPDSKATPAPDATTETETAPGEEPKSNRQAGKEAYERGLAEGRDAARREAEADATRRAAEQASTNQTRQFEELLQRAQSGDLAASEQLIGLLSSHRATETAKLLGRNELLETLGKDVAQGIASLDGADEETRKALMQAPSVAEFGKQAFEHGRRLEKATWEPEIAKRDATIEQLRGQLAGKRTSPEAASGIRTNGAAEFDGSWESALRLAQAAS